jgi:1,4-dihydroxy-2-naphthoate octaprenyltransferase
MFVFLFFGIVAVVGSFYVQVERLRWEAFAVAAPVGLLAAAILVVNNVRDIETDRRAGKRTLAVRLGRLRARRLYAVMIVLSYLAPVVIWAAGGLTYCVMLPLLSAPLAVPLMRTVGTRTDGASLNAALAGTGRLLAVYSVLLAAGILLS